jgi:hypothetical protein
VGFRGRIAPDIDTGNVAPAATIRDAERIIPVGGVVIIADLGRATLG